MQKSHAQTSIPPTQILYKLLESTLWSCTLTRNITMRARAGMFVINQSESVLLDDSRGPFMILPEIIRFSVTHRVLALTATSSFKKNWKKLWNSEDCPKITPAL